MIRSGKYAVPTALMLGATLLSTAAFAEGLPSKAQESTSQVPASTDANTNTAIPDSASLLGIPLSLTELDKHRGGQDTVVNDMKLNGVVTNNSAFNLTTGTNSVSQGAFANASGLPLVIQNSGNNVLIQSATILNVQIK